MDDADLVARLRAAGCVYAEDEAAILRGSAAGAALEALVARRVAGEPLEQVVGWASFCGLRVKVVPGVFVPRRRTEFLVRLATSFAPRVVLDLCAGTGALGAALVAGLAHPVELHVAELDPVAVTCARSNVPPGTQVYGGDLYAPLPDGLRRRVDVLLANAPYVPTGELGYLPPEAREHEPAWTLDGGGDGLDVHRRIAAGARDWLAPGGRLLVEVSDRQVEAMLGILVGNGLVARVEEDDDLGAIVILGTVETGPRDILTS